MKVSIELTERYPDYGIGRPRDYDTLTIPDEKVEWIERVADEYEQVQEYLARAFKAVAAAAPVRYCGRRDRLHWLAHNSVFTADRHLIRWFHTPEEAQAALDAKGEGGTVEPSHVHIPLAAEWGEQL